MTRTREFDPGAALDDAMKVFWAKGYSDTSMEDLVSATGVSRYGIYGTFGNKREFFAKALANYAERQSRELLGAVASDGASVQEIRDFFDTRLAVASSEAGRRGCLICNTATELAPHDAEMERAVGIIFVKMAAGFVRALDNARAAGEISAETESRDMARYLVGVMLSLSVFARAGMPAEDMRSYVKTALLNLR
jgi:TetR/AcrR family transcriptional repressor of nem operon